MILNEIHISNIRNIRSARLSFHPHLNIVSGVNGSGKTSFLESLYLLMSGHSFRTREIESLVLLGQESLTVFGRTDSFETISLQKSIHSPTIARINGSSCANSSQLAAFLPSLVFYQDIFQFIDLGPSLRRTFLDWGLFHVEHDYLKLLKDYKRIIKQRNLLLRERVQFSTLLPWNTLLSSLAEQLHNFRFAYYNQLKNIFRPIAKLITDIDCDLVYYKGWDKKNEHLSLLDILKNSHERDILRQYTHYGAHHADLIVEANDTSVKNFFSRGQQKAIVFALKFAQAKLLAKPCLLLIDDLVAELDENHVSRILNYITDINAQIFITARNQDSQFIKQFLSNYQCFSVEAGEFKPV